MVSTSFPRDGGDWQGRFIHDMARSLAARGDLSISLWAPPGELPPGVQAAANERESVWLADMVRRGGIAQILRRDGVRGVIAAAWLVGHQWSAYRRIRADLVHVNWLQNALALGCTRTPALVTVLGSDLGLLRLPGMRTTLRTVLGLRRAVLAPNAEWMLKPLRAALGDATPMRAVPFGVAGEWFNVGRQSGVVENGDWLVVCRVTRNKIGDLLDWGHGLFGTTRRLHLLGPIQEEMALPAWVQYHGPTHPDALRSQWFPRAAGLITLSRHDEGRPQVMLEAMAAGLPVVASDQPAHRDFVRQSVTGCLVSSRHAFAAGLESLANDAENRRIGAAGRAWVKAQVGTWEDCSERYVALYRELLDI